MPKPTAPQCHAMTTYYIGAVAAAYGEAPVVNRNKARYTFEALWMDNDKDEVKAIIDFYVEHYEPNIEWLNYNYEKVIEAKREHEKNQKIIAQRRRDTALRLEQWKQRKQEWEK